MTSIEERYLECKTTHNPEKLTGQPLSHQIIVKLERTTLRCNCRNPFLRRADLAAPSKILIEIFMSSLGIRRFKRSQAGQRNFPLRCGMNPSFEG